MSYKLKCKYILIHESYTSVRRTNVGCIRAAVPASEVRGEPRRLQLGGALRAGAAPRPVQGGGASVPRAAR